MTKIYKKLVEEFGYVAEAPINATGYDPDQVQYAYKDGKANPNYPGAQVTPGPDTSNYTDPRGTDNVTNDPVKNKPKKKPGSGANAGTRALQHWLNSKGIKVAVDGKYGPETKGALEKYFNDNIYGKTPKPEVKAEYQAMMGVGTAHQVRVTPGSGNMYIGSPEYIAAMNKYGFDVKTGDPIGGAKTGPAPGQGGQTNVIPTDPKGKASAISKAISGPGTDEAAVYAIIDTIKDKAEYEQIAAAYKAAWGGRRELASELEGDFSGIDLVDLNKRLARIGLQLSVNGQMNPISATPTATKTPPGKTAESADLNAIKFLAGLK